MYQKPYEYSKENAHLVFPYDGVVGKKFTCVRCKRELPEQQFAFMGELRRAHKRVIALHLHCHSCREQRRGKWTEHPDYSPGLDRFWHKKMSTLRSGAFSRGLTVAIDKDDLLELWFKQAGCCAITGLELNWKSVGAAGRGNKAHFSPSVDRIDSRGNYVPDNIQIVANVVNRMKGDLALKSFIDLCGVIASHNMTL
jgi:hypothetical protein